MKAILCDGFGPPSALRFGEVPPPVIGPDEVMIRVAAAGINFPDTLIIEGKYQGKPAFPFSPGFEVAGEVKEIGTAVSDVALGDRVMALPAAGFGGFAEEVSARASEIVPIPPDLDYATAAAFYTAYGTAYHALVQRARLRSGETLVVLGASGGVGLAAVELGKALGATVIAVARTVARLAQAAEKGADHLVGYEQEGWRDEIAALTAGKGADVCIDMVGGTAFDVMSRTMAWGGRLLVVGFTSGDIPRLSVNLPLLKGYELVGVFWGGFIARDPGANRANFAAMASLIEAGHIAPGYSRSYRLQDVPAALGALLNRETTGKLVVEMEEVGS